MKKTRLIAAFILIYLTANAQEAYVTPRKICQLPSEILESSGISISGVNLVWSHEDSGNDNKIYGFDTLGNLKRTITISNVSNIDWEDLATDEDGNIFIADMGNNNNIRTDLAIYKIPDPESFSSNSVNAEIISVSFADQTAFPPPLGDRNFDIESMIWRSGSLYLFTKDRSYPFTGITKMYCLDDQPGTYLLQPVTSLYVGSEQSNDRVTAADYNRSTGELVLLTHSRLISFTNYPGDQFFDGEKTEYFFSEEVGQNEAVGFISPRRLYMTEEGEGGVSGWLYEIRLPESTGTGSVQETITFSVSPVPARNFISVESSLPDNIRVMVTSSEGKILLRSTLGQCRELNINSFPAGKIYISLQSENIRYTRSFIKQ